MKKNLVFFVAVALLLTGATALAATGDNTVTGNVKFQKGTVNTIRPLGQALGVKAEAKITMITGRLDDAIGRIENLYGRVKSRIEKWKTDGKNVGAAEAKLAEADTALSAAKSAVANFSTQAGTAVSSGTTVSAKVLGLRQLVMTTVAKIKAAHQSVVTVITELKNIK